MKKWMAAALCALLLLAACPALAAQEIALPGTQIAVDLPEGWAAVTRESALTDGGALDMSPADAGQFLEDNDYYLYLYEEETGAEIYVALLPTAYAQSAGNLTNLAGDALDQVMRDLEVPYEDWTVDGDVARIERGGRAYLEIWMHSGEGADRVDNRQLFTMEDGLEIYIDLYAYDGAAVLADAQDALAESLRFVEDADAAAPEESARRALAVWKGRRAGAYLLAGLMIDLLICVVGLAMAVYLGTRRE
jgi:hypothetical protein